VNTAMKLDPQEALAALANNLVVKKLEHLPIVKVALDRLDVAKTIDELVPPDPRNVVTTGECVEALVTTILMGCHTLYQAADTLEPFDCELAFSWGDRVPHFTDERLAKALDHVFRAGVPNVNAAFLANAIRAYGLDVSQSHFDTTSIKTYGEYYFSEEPDDPEDPQAIPHVTRGHSKDKRPDLKQILYGLTVSGDGGVPFVGRVASGNRSDVSEVRFNLRRLAEVLPNPSESLVVGDSKTFSGETFLLYRENKIGFVTLMPRSVGLWDGVVDRFLADDQAETEPRLLKVKLDENTGDPSAFWWGRSYDVAYEYKAEDRVVHSIPLKALVVRSSGLETRKRGSLQRRQERERMKLDRKATKIAKRTFACETDATAAADSIRAVASTFHGLEIAVRYEDRPKKRKRSGRPSKDEVRETERVWRVDVDVLEPSEGRFEEVLRRESTFVVVACGEHPLTVKLKDADLLAAYQDQHKVETAMRWLKGPLSVAPIFLKTEERIAALGLVYVLALMIYALIQRHARAALAAGNTTMPSNKGWNDKPTTEVVFRLFRGVQTIRIASAGVTVVKSLHTEHVRIYALLDADLASWPGVRLEEPRVPRPGERAFKPRPRATKKKSAKKKPARKKSKT